MEKKNNNSDNGKLNARWAGPPAKNTKYIRRLTRWQKVTGAVVALYERIVFLVKEHEVALSIFVAALGWVAFLSGLAVVFITDPEKFANSPKHWLATLLWVWGGGVFALSATNAFEALQKYRTSP